MKLPRDRGRTRRILIPALVVAVLCGVAVIAVLWATRDAGDDAPLADVIEHGALSDGWQPVDVASPDDRYVMRATGEGEGGVDRQTSFVLESRVKDLDAEALRERLAVDPAFQFEVDGDSGKLTIAPVSPLRAGAAYRFTLRDPADGRELRSWAFQTESPLRIVQTLPGDAAPNVPLNTGIELTFSHDGVTGVEDRFSIAPSVEGRFEVHKRVVVFVPKRLEPETLYTVTIAPGTTVAGTDLEATDAFSFSFETGSANRDDSPYGDQSNSFARLVNESSTSEPPVMQVMSYGASETVSLPVEVYRYPDASAFAGAIEEASAVPAWSVYARRDFRLGAAGLDQVATFTTDTLVAQNSPYAAQYIVFPEALLPGFYLVQATPGVASPPSGGAPAPAQALLQVTDLATYASVTTTDTLVWVNDLASGAPVEGASVVDDDGGATSLTGADGVAVFETPLELRETGAAQPLYDGSTPPERKPRTLRVEHDGRTAIVPLDAGVPIAFNGYYDYSYGRYGYCCYYGAGGAENFWSYMYSDRSLYRKTDEVNFWGIARRREAFQAGEKLTVRLTGGGYYGYDYQPSVLAETSVTVNDNGTFKGSIAFEGASSGGYTLEAVTQDGDIVTQTYVQTMDFVTPAYKLDVVASPSAAISGDTMSFEFRTEFFDGSPAPGVDLSYSGLGAPDLQQLTTDDNGIAVVTQTAVGGFPLEGPWYQSVYAYPTGPEAAEISGEVQWFVLPAALTVDAETSVDDGSASVTGAVYNVDLSKFEDDSGYIYGADYLGAAVPGRAVTATITEIRYDKVESGEYYDFIAKLTRKTYSYNEVTRALPAVALTSAADGTFSFDFPVEDEHWYRIEISVQDDAGRTGGTKTSVSGGFVDYLPYSDPFLRITEKDAAASPTFGYGYSEPSRWSAGERVELRMVRNGTNAESGGQNRYLYMRERSGLVDYTVDTAPEFAFDFSADDVPGVYIDGVQFNGRGYETVNGPYMAQFDYEDRQLDVQVTADGERYEPGDEVTLSVETRDMAGNPVGADVLLSAVDEAIFRVAGGYDYEQEMLERLYQPVSPGVLQAYVPSYATSEELLIPSPNTGGGRGGGDSSGALAPPDTGPGTNNYQSRLDPRSNFRDIALFEAVRTGGDGRGSVTFTLPDNITSWRVTSRAVTGDLLAGGSLTNVPSGLPFFIEVTANTEYLVADRPIISLRSFGRSLQRGDAVEYLLFAPGLGIDGATVQGFAFEPASFPLPPLVEGEHEITVEARSGELADAVVGKVNVVTSRLQRAEARFDELGSGTALEGSVDRPTRVVFSDHNRGRYFDDLSRLVSTHGDRLDQMLARNVAQQLLRDQFDAEPFWAPASFDASLYQSQEDGGLALFPYADDELLLSVRALSVAPTQFERARLAQYFRAILDDPGETRERAIIALFGLASAGEPVLPSITNAAAESDLTVRERLYLGLAALAAGDEEQAREQYRQVMLRFGERRDPFVRIRTGEDQDDILEATALAADLAAGLGDPSAGALFEYTMANWTTDLLVELEQVSFLARALPRLPSQPVKFSYLLDGSRHEESLEAGRSFSLRVTPEQLASLDPQAIEGQVGVATYFEAPFDPGAAAVDPDVSITRIMDVEGDGIGIDDVVMVRLDYVLGPQSLDGCYEVTDIAPSGLRPITQLYRGPNYASDFEYIWPYRVDGQRVHFCVYDSDHYYPARYYARVVTPGTYTAEPAIIQSQQSAQSFNLTPSETIEIGQ